MLSPGARRFHAERRRGGGRGGEKKTQFFPSPRGLPLSAPPRGSVAVLFALLLLAPLAAAHVDDARPILQRSERERTVDARMEGLVAVVDLHQSVDPLRETVRHVIDPARGRLTVEHRPDASDRESAFNATWELTRILEYRDLNADGRFQPNQDTAVRVWRLQNYRWNATPIRDVSVGGVAAKSVIWEGALGGAPTLRLEMAVAGKEFTDEGALARAQDVMLYLDVRGLPPRGVGSLYAIDGSFTFTPGATPSAALAQGNVTTGALVDAPARRALLIWGGEALLDGREQRIFATVGEPGTSPDGLPSSALRLHMPLMDSTMHFVLVSGIEYEVPAERAPGPWLALAVLLVAGVAVLSRARRG